MDFLAWRPARFAARLVVIAAIDVLVAGVIVRSAVGAVVDAGNLAMVGFLFGLAVVVGVPTAIIIDTSAGRLALSALPDGPPLAALEAALGRHGVPIR